MGKKDSAQAVTLHRCDIDACTAPFGVGFSLKAVDIHLIASLMVTLPAPSPATGMNLR